MTKCFHNKNFFKNSTTYFYYINRLC